MIVPSIQAELRDRLSLPEGVEISTKNNRLVLTCPALEQRDFVFQQIESLAVIGTALGFDYMIVSVKNTQLIHRFKFSALLRLDKEMRSQHPTK